MPTDPLDFIQHFAAAIHCTLQTESYAHHERPADDDTTINKHAVCAKLDDDSIALLVHTTISHRATTFEVHNRGGLLVDRVLHGGESIAKAVAQYLRRCRSVATALDPT